MNKNEQFAPLLMKIDNFFLYSRTFTLSTRVDNPTTLPQSQHITKLPLITRPLRKSPPYQSQLTKPQQITVH